MARAARGSRAGTGPRRPRPAPRRRHRPRGGRCWRRGRRCRRGTSPPARRPGGRGRGWPGGHAPVGRPSGDAERGLGHLAPRQRRLVLDLDHLGDDREGIGVEAFDRAAVQGLPPEQDRLAEAEVVHPAEGGGAEGPVEVGRVAAGDEVDRMPGRLDRRPTRSDSSPMFPASGAMPLWQARFVPTPTRRGGGGRGPCHDPCEVGRQDALAQVAHLDHEQDAVDRSSAARRRPTRASSTSTSVLQLMSAARRPGRPGWASASG